MEAHTSITKIHKSWLIIELHDYVFPFWHAILQPVLSITMNTMRKNETQLMNE